MDQYYYEAFAQMKYLALQNAN